MNLKRISFYLGLFCFPISLLAFINILYASYFDFFLSIDTYFITLIVSLVFGFGLTYYGKNSEKNIIHVSDYNDSLKIVDIGFKSIKSISELLKNIEIAIWNGSMGVFEWEQYSTSSYRDIDGSIIYGYVMIIIDL